MISAFNKLKKLRGRSFAEFRARAGQAVAARGEMYGISAGSRPPADAEFSKLLSIPFASSAEHSAEKLRESFRARRSPNFFAAFDDPAATKSELRRRWPESAASVVTRAERVLAGRFDLLGLRDLDFGDPVDWHREPISGKSSPRVHWSRIAEVDSSQSGDKKIVWELNRHQFFQTLGRAYWLTGDERFARGFVAHIARWMEKNPPTIGVNWVSNLEVAFRSIAWLWALHFFEESTHLTPDIFLRVLKYLYLHGRHLETYLSTYVSPNTHLTGEALGLFYLGTLLPELKCAGRWRAVGAGVLLERLARHVRPDGTYFEQTSYYHRYTTDFYTHFLILSRANNQSVGTEVEERLAGLLDHLMYITKPDGTTPIFGDDDGGRLAMLGENAPNDFRAALSTGVALFGRSDYKYVAGEVAEETLWLLGPEGLRAFDALDARPPAETSRAFPDGGYYVMRDDWTTQSNYLLIDCGPHGEATCGHAHAHADALALIELAARGRTLLVDPGTYAYTSSIEARDWFRSTAAHNALTVDGESSSAPGGPFAWKQVAGATPRAWVSRGRFDFFEGEHDGYARPAAPATHIRSVLFLKGGYWVVRDRVEAEGAHRYELHFHFAPDARPNIEGGIEGGDEESVVVGEPRDDAPGLRLFSFGAGGRWRGGEGWVSPCYGARVNAPVYTFSAKAENATEVVSFIIPRAPGEPETRVCRLGTASHSRAFELTNEASQDFVALSDGGRVEAGGLVSDFAWSIVRAARDVGQVGEFLALDGRRLVFDDAELFGAADRVGYVSARLCGDELVVETDARGRFSVAAWGAARVLLNGEAFAVNGALQLHFMDGRVASHATEITAAGILV